MAIIVQPRWGIIQFPDAVPDAVVGVCQGRGEASPTTIVHARKKPTPLYYAATQPQALFSPVEVVI